MTGAAPPPVPGRAAAASAAQPWIEKYRPKSLSDVTAHKRIIDTIKKLVAEDRLPHLLLYGPPGTGKTSTILAVAREMYGPSYSNMTLELNASDDRGIDVVRQEVQEFASTRRIFAKDAVKLVVLDECDAMTKDAQFALRRVIEKYTRSTRFCLICNYVNKIIHALQSRCTRFRFAPLSPADAEARLRHVVEAEGVRASPEALQAVLRVGAGDMRKTLNVLQSVAMASSAASGGGEVGEGEVYACTGQPTPCDVERLCVALLNEPYAEAHGALSELQRGAGVALVDVVRELGHLVFRVHMPPEARAALVEALAAVEYNLSTVPDPRLQACGLVGAFTQARAAIAGAGA